MQTTTEWFKDLSDKERKALVCMLFDLRSLASRHKDLCLFTELIRVMDNEYHSLK